MSDSAYIEDEQGNRVVDFSRHNLHVVGYSTPVDVWLAREELDKHLHSLPDQPDAIPYVTSYYEPRWGFCLAHHDRVRLKEGRYHAVIDSDLKDGSLTYAEWVLPGRVQEEVFFSSYVCHPSLANNELSGPVVTTFLAQWLASTLENTPIASSLFPRRSVPSPTSAGIWRFCGTTSSPVSMCRVWAMTAPTAMSPRPTETRLPTGSYTESSATAIRDSKL